MRNSGSDRPSRTPLSHSWIKYLLSIYYVSGCLSIEDVAVNKMNAAPEVLALRRAYILINGEGKKGYPK